MQLVKNPITLHPPHTHTDDPAMQPGVRLGVGEGWHNKNGMGWQSRRGGCRGGRGRDVAASSLAPRLPGVVKAH